jgi:farnesyl diphosphate synthase
VHHGPHPAILAHAVSRLCPRFQICDDLIDTDGDEAAAGKRLHKDADAGKATFVSLLGPERARQQAAMLVDQAIAHLHEHGAEADLLRAIARYVLERDR